MQGRRCYFSNTSVALHLGQDYQKWSGSLKANGGYHYAVSKDQGYLSLKVRNALKQTFALDSTKHYTELHDCLCQSKNTKMDYIIKAQ